MLAMAFYKLLPSVNRIIVAFNSLSFNVGALSLVSNLLTDKSHKSDHDLASEKQERYLQNHPEIDFYVLHEGEVAFLNILKTVDETGLNFNAGKPV